MRKDEIEVCNRLNRVLQHLKAANEKSQVLTFEPCINKPERPDHHFLIKIKHSREDASVRVGMSGQSVVVSFNEYGTSVDSYETMGDANRVIEIVEQYICKLKAAISS